MINRLHVMTFTVVLVLAALVQAQTFTTLYNFTGGRTADIPTPRCSATRRVTSTVQPIKAVLPATAPYLSFNGRQGDSAVQFQGRERRGQPCGGPDR